MCPEAGYRVDARFWSPFKCPRCASNSPVVEALVADDVVVVVNLVPSLPLTVLV